jgi:cyclic beta-1,2-glucan synthetase
MTVVETAVGAGAELEQAESSQAALEAIAKQLATAHQAVTLAVGERRPLLKDPKRHEGQLLRAQQHYAAETEEHRVVSYAGEWLLDNFYIVQQALRQLIEDIPPRFYDELPKLTAAPMAGTPRIYALARRISEWRSSEPLTMDQVTAFVHAYQAVTPLTMGELWALPAVLRAVNIENLIWALGLLTGAEDNASVLAGIDAPDEVFGENHVANAIINLRMLAAQDWMVFFESVSLVEQILQQDPAGVYLDMDASTRNRYRRAIETLKRTVDIREEHIAQFAIDFAAEASSHADADPREGHVGYYLLGAGQHRLQAKFDPSPSLATRLRYLRENRPAGIYLAFIAVLMLAILIPLAVYTTSHGANTAQLLLTLAIAFFPASAVAVNVTNWLISRAVQPACMPKMDYSKGIPAGCRAVVVVPAMLSDIEEIDSLANQLELHYIRNLDPNIKFALLADLLDAPLQSLPEDAALIAHAGEAIDALNARYGFFETGGPFYLFLRERRWNPSENAWIGWERKRGKLTEFNALLLDPSAETSYGVKHGDLDGLTGVSYVITLDADTILPKDAARRLIAAMAHPLNRPRFDSSGRVVDGYTILQPRVEIGPSANSRTRFSRIFAGDTGFDLYTLAVSDVYQDWMGEGIFTGKGIYEVAGFERSLQNRTPENTILSHDLFEGIHGRAGLVTDIVLLEDYPPHYLVHTRRLHRWIRGDWQLLPWLGSRVPLADNNRAPTPLGMIDRWKLFDNLRRSLLPPAFLLLFVAGWTVLPGSPQLWTAFGLLASAATFFTTTANMLLRRGTAIPPQTLWQDVKSNALRWWLSLVFLPHEAFLTVDAVARTLYRLAVRRNLLQWTTAARTQQAFRSDSLAAMWQEMLPASASAAVLGAILALARPETLLTALSLLALWFMSPAVAYILSKPVRQPAPELSTEDITELRRLARQTWLFFEQFVGPEDHWLPPDHFQESPRGIIAHHTSPTNIGLMLLSTLGAYDLGYIGLLDLSTRLKLTFETLEKLERHRGHFLNWYDTRSLAPLPPVYVSTVDSGNLACSLLALRHGLDELEHIPVIRPQRWDGIRDTLSVLDESLEAFAAVGSAAEIVELKSRLAEIIAEIDIVRADPRARTAFLRRLTGSQWPEFTRLLVTLLEADRDRLGVEQLAALRLYAERAGNQIANIDRHTRLLVPWLPLMTEPPALFEDARLEADVRDLWEDLVEGLPFTVRLNQIPDVSRDGRHRLMLLQERLAQNTAPSESWRAAQAWCAQLLAAMQDSGGVGEMLHTDFLGLAVQIDALLDSMDFTFLFDTQRKLFHIGYNVSNDRLDNNYYDLLASEARLASLFTIATGQIPQEHWLHLGRPQTRIGDMPALMSWSGTMFEYLMPLLLMRSTPGTLLDQSYDAVVEAHKQYGAQKGVPWGISESGYFAFDGNQNYQYRAFGVPSVAFKRGMSADLVIAPYASMIALPVDPPAVMDNLDALKQAGGLGRYGLYEAIDYTQSRLQLGQEKAVVREYMAHHQGMILLTLVNVMLDDIMVRRFHADTRVQSVELLLQEQIPYAVEVQFPPPEHAGPPRPDQVPLNTSAWPAPVNAAVPQVHYLSNGRYGVVINGAGGGYSQWQDTAVTRWRSDTTLEDWGSWLYIRDQDDGRLWSAAQHPTAVQPDARSVTFFPHKAQFQRRDRDISLEMEVVVPPEDDLEIRRVRLTNHSDRPRRLLVVSYAEVVLASQDSDRRHPAFSKLFVESEHLPQFHGLLFRRRPRANDDPALFALHMIVSETGGEVDTLFKADRAKFLGRNRTAAAPQAMVDGTLSGTVGATLDPVMALGREIVLPPQATVQLAYITAAAKSRDAMIALARNYQTWSLIDRAFDQARYRSEQEMRQLDIHSPDIQNFQKMLSALLYPHAALRAAPTVLAANAKAQPGLWAFGISGDYPIVVVRIGDETEVALVRELVQAHRYWRNRQIKVTLVVLNARDTGYTQELYNQVHRLIVRMGSETWINRHDGIFLLRADLLSEADQVLLMAAARVVVDGRDGPLARQLESASQTPVYLPAFTQSLDAAEDLAMPPLSRPEGLLFDNGYGGFSPHGREYVIYRDRDHTPPAPWSNVIANPDFGFTVTESGGGYTWSGNSSENRLTAWRNDPVTDMPAEAVYIRDEETAQVWSPTPLPAAGDTPVLVRHGHGYSVFEQHSRQLKQTMTLFAATDAPVKIIRLRLENTAQRPRRITATYYAEWVLGTFKDVTQQYIIPEFHAAGQTLLFRNPYSIDFGGQYAFITASQDFHGLTTDRTEFLGRLGDYARPAALERIGLSGTVQAGIDPCAAVQLHVDLPPGASEEVFFVIGAAPNREAAVELARTYRSAGQMISAWDAVNAFWQQTLTQTTVKTPDKAMNAILPWLLYQALSCRIWGRSALYQSGGAFGFRDQLQDVMALVHSHPHLTREQILRAARHQFDAGDVLHWWHPPSGRGVRTRFSDDLVWLPYVTAFYIGATGDTAILDEAVPYLRGEPLKPDEEERYGNWEPAAESHTIYEHCKRALNRASTVGAHGLPLMGSGDWNDGMNRVGIHGRGESVWMGWFLYTALDAFAPLCEARGDSSLAETYRLRMEEYRQALEANAWDGQWYLRAFYDDGTPLGSEKNAECRIDSLSQSWAVISKAADKTRARQAMESAMARLVDRSQQLMLLFEPPFDKTERDPGYIKGYVPGIRENGGQYTHAAIWTVWAFTELGDGDRAGGLFSLLNPICHGSTPESIETYKVEPYVIAADVYGVAPHTGRGGWTWYTGSSGWMYRLGIEAILGLKREGDHLRIDPCIPGDWPGFSATYRANGTVYNIRVENPRQVSRGVTSLTLDGQSVSDSRIPLTTADGTFTREVVATLG